MLTTLVQPLLPILGELLAILATALVAYLVKLLRDKVGLDIETARRDALQTAITNAAGQVVMQLGGKIGTGAIHPGALSDAVAYVRAAAPDAVKHFDLHSVALAEKVVAKVGVLTAAIPPEQKPTGL
ncbi:hypothetical protein [Ancylobacter defluvii]|uniref:Holin n=1 Tax=Ancylobacter defluvii TaxID=1282440 RepID=A0A9W6JZE3_9HYPH|nr:hypothetical protein [Ancylobacter defluvii]MBS7588303.1 hypothetical protein [Ancylobacter defluvii]GLK86700.1 hypothetical protein GCM10017653_47700 [Ancylobacter defluvii]